MIFAHPYHLSRVKVYSKLLLCEAPKRYANVVTPEGKILFLRHKLIIFEIMSYYLIIQFERLITRSFGLHDGSSI